MASRIHDILRTVFGRQPRADAAVQFLRYVISGGTAFVFDYATVLLLTELAGFPYLLSTACGFCVGLLITYFMSVVWIFDERRVANKTGEFLVFGVIALTGIALSLGFMWLFTDICSIDYRISKLITTVIVSVWNFVLKKKILFTK